MKMICSGEMVELAVARLLINRQRAEQALPRIEAIPVMADEYEAASQLKEVVVFHLECEKAGGEAASRERLGQEEKNLDVRFGLASCLASAAYCQVEGLRADTTSWLRTSV